MTDLLAVEARILDALEPGGRPALAALLRTVVGQFDD